MPEKLTVKQAQENVRAGGSALDRKVAGASATEDHYPLQGRPVAEAGDDWNPTGYVHEDKPNSDEPSTISRSVHKPGSPLPPEAEKLARPAPQPTRHPKLEV